MLEIKLKNPDVFLVIKETLTRMGIANTKDKVLYQSCHIYANSGKYYVAHFKELLKSDGLAVDITEEDILRRNNIALLLSKWNLCEIVGNHEYSDHNFFRIISHKEKSDWKLITKYKYL